MITDKMFHSALNVAIFGIGLFLMMMIFGFFESSSFADAYDDNSEDNPTSFTIKWVYLPANGQDLHGFKYVDGVRYDYTLEYGKTYTSSYTCSKNCVYYIEDGSFHIVTVGDTRPDFYQTDAQFISDGYIVGAPGSWAHERHTINHTQDGYPLSWDGKIYDSTLSNHPDFVAIGGIPKSSTLSGALYYLIDGDPSYLEILDDIRVTGEPVYNPSIPVPYGTFERPNNAFRTKFTLLNDKYDNVNHGVYGLELVAKWLYIDDLHVESVQTGLQPYVKISYSHFDESGSYFDMGFDNVFDLTTSGSLVKSTTYLDFDNNVDSVSHFTNNLPSSSNRFASGSNPPQNVGSDFNKMLNDSNGGYNFVMFTCRYYRFNKETGRFEYGNTASFSSPIFETPFTFKISGSSVYPNGPVVPYYPPIKPVNPDGPDDPVYPDYPDIPPYVPPYEPPYIPDNPDDPDWLSTLKDLINSIGQVPLLITTLFSWLPAWVTSTLAIFIVIIGIGGIFKLIRG